MKTTPLYKKCFYFSSMAFLLPDTTDELSPKSLGFISHINPGKRT